MSIDIKNIEQTFNTELVDNNVEAMKIVDDYKEISDLMEQVNIAMGRKQQYQVINNSAINITLPE